MVHMIKLSTLFGENNVTYLHTFPESSDVEIKLFMKYLMKNKLYLVRSLIKLMAVSKLFLLILIIIKSTSLKKAMIKKESYS